MTITCPVCGSENPDTSEFCEACGQELGGPATVGAPPLPPKLDDTVIDIFSPGGSSKETVRLEPAPGDFLPPPPPPPPPQIAGTARLICKQPGVPTSEFLLDGSNALIGKFDPDTGPVDVDLEGFPGDEHISRLHGEIYAENGLWKIKDIGSVNGIFIKPLGQGRFGARITLPEALKPGDEIAIAKIKFLFQSP
ncbi:FHA domain-containing protein [Oscillatoria acuminata]|uniref:FHA domain-containing protein n=1 Tax=Oscillatoria acuminata PCC 6304 TaxID=56110 RepID=K9TNV6_9CYAN|nr:FHA domain-containing protein [Oscillatoria acuminata]AFY83806.1 FHA domain-containing protein [Oscillatoria acuminata PCC 6304]